jgi:hypothetical protein
MKDFELARECGIGALLDKLDGYLNSPEQVALQDDLLAALSTFASRVREQERAEASRDAARWRWYMSNTLKSGRAMCSYLMGCRERWTLDKWNAWADEAMSEGKEE